MESTTATHHLESMTKDEDVNYEQKSSVSAETDSGIISVQLLEFKTRLLEAVEELHIQRDAGTRYEAHVCHLVLDKQELEWQKESLQNQIECMKNDHSESLAALKKQFQAQIRGIEGEKGKHQLSAELKDKEISSLKEELKCMQLFKYSLEKKLSELEQKLHLQTQVKDSHLNQLGEVEKRFGTISRQYGMIKQAQEKLEQNVDAAVRLNNKLASINIKQEATISTLKKDVKRLNSELVKLKVLSICESGEGSSNFLLKDQQLQDLKQRLTAENELNEKLRNESAVERAEKQELMNSLQLAQRLLEAHTQALNRTEQQLLKHTEDYQVLKREHEVLQERRKEKEDRLVQLIEEYKNSNMTLEKEIKRLQAKMQADHEELRAVREAYDLLQEEQQQACVMHQARHMNASENDSNENFNMQIKSACELNCDINQDTTGNPSKDASLETKGSQACPHDEQKKACTEDEDVPDERAAECQEAAVGGAHAEVNVRSEMDRSVLALPPLQSRGAPVPETRDGVSGTDVASQQIREDFKQDATAPVQNICDNASSSSAARNDTDDCVAELSEPQTRSVYGVAIDPVMPESSRNVSEMPEQQTPDKNTSEDCEDVMTSAPETNTEYKLCTEEPQSEVLYTGHNGKPEPQDQIALDEKTLEKQTHDTMLPCAASASDPAPRNLKDQPSKVKEGSLIGLQPTTGHPNGTEDAKCIPATPAESFSKSAANLAATGNETDDNAKATQLQSDQRSTDVHPDPQIPNPHEEASLTATVTKIIHEPPDVERQMIHSEAFCGVKTYRSSFETNMAAKQAGRGQLFVPLGRTNAFSAAEHKSVVPSGFQDLLTSLHIPVFAKPKLRNKGGLDKMDNIHPDRKSGEWNAIKQSFSEITAEKECRVPISFGSARPGSPAARSVGNGLRQNCTATPPPRLSSLGKVSRPMCEETTPTPSEKGECQADFRAQIAKIEQFLSSEGLMMQKRRRVEEDVEPKPFS